MAVCCVGCRREGIDLLGMRTFTCDDCDNGYREECASLWDRQADACPNCVGYLSQNPSYHGWKLAAKLYVGPGFPASVFLRLPRRVAVDAEELTQGLREKLLPLLPAAACVLAFPFKNAAVLGALDNSVIVI